MRHNGETLAQEERHGVAVLVQGPLARLHVCKMIRAC